MMQSGGDEIARKSLRLPRSPDERSAVLDPIDALPGWLFQPPGS